MNYFTKPLFIAVSMCIFTALMPSLHAQDVGVKINLGWAQMPVQAGGYFLQYIDDSPSRDNLTTSRRLQAQSGSFNMYMALSMLADEGFLDIGMLIMAGQANFTAVDIGLGLYLLNSLGVDVPNLQAGAKLHLGAGRKSVYMGDLLNNAEYIQINGQRFYQDYLSVYLRSEEFTARPGLFAQYRLFDKMSLNLEIDYHLRMFGFAPRLVFTADETANGDPVRATERFDDPNVSLFTTNRGNLEKLPLKINGLQARIGVVIIL